MIDKITLSDSDIISMDESTGDIVISVAKLPEYEQRAQKDMIKVHYVEDADNIDHEYKIRDFDIDNATVMLDWVQQLEEEVLTEAPSLKKLFNREPDFGKSVADGTKNSEKADWKAEKQSQKFNKKVLMNASKLIKRDMSADGKPWLFYIPKNGVYDFSKPLTQEQAREIYQTMGKEPDPDILNAIVTLPSDTSKKQFIVRRGMEDLFKSGKTLTRATAEVDPSYKLPYKEAPASEEEIPASVEPEATPAEIATAEAPVTTETPKETSKGFSEKLLKRFTGLAIAADMTVTDTKGKPVKLDFKNPIKAEDVANYMVGTPHGLMSLSGWLTSAVNKDLITESTTPEQMKLLVESPVITLDDADTMNPTEIDFKKKIQQATEKERQAAELANKKQAEEKLKQKYAHLATKITDNLKAGRTAVETIGLVFDDIVPAVGQADSKAGELLRAVMRILYRDHNDGDKFFEGYGIETCGSSAEYLFDNGFAEDIQKILDTAEFLSDDDEKYSDAIMVLAEHVLDRIVEDNSLLWTVNTEDSRDYSTDYIEENQPRYEFELYGSDDLINLVENDVLTSWDLNSYVDHVLSFDRVYEGAEAARPWGHHDTSVTVVNLTKDGYDYLRDAFNHDPEGWWADLVAEHVDDLTTDNYDDDYEDDGSYEQD